MLVIDAVSALCAPMDPRLFYYLLQKNGFSEAAYLESNRHLATLEDTPLRLIGDFCTEGVKHRRYFKARTKHLDVARSLASIGGAEIADQAYRTSLLAVFARALINEKFFADPNRGEHFDKFSDAEIASLIDMKQYRTLPYFVFGDSHSRLYQHLRILPDNHLLLPLKITFSAASARGLANLNSHLQNGVRLRRIVDRIRPWVEAHQLRSFFKFGQVDLEYVHPFNRLKAGRTAFDAVEFWSFCEQSIGRYLGYMASIVPMELRHLATICSVSPPALLDEHWAPGYVSGNFGSRIPADRAALELEQARRLEIPTIEERTQLHASFTRQLQARAKDQGFAILDDAAMFLRPDGSRVEDIYIKRLGGKDTHLDRDVPTLTLMERLIGPLVR